MTTTLLAEKVAVLCVSRNSIYNQFDNVDVFDIDRDARTFDGLSPIIAHPPCRAWSAFCRHQAKPGPGEKRLGLWCCEQLKKNGGVLEQPAFSRLFHAGGLPPRGVFKGDLFTIEVNQSWWGYPMIKKTWLCFSRIDPHEIQLPPQSPPPPGSRRTQQKMSKHQRAATCREFAEFLIKAASKAK